MILPPVLARQVFVVEAQHKETGFRAPAAVITWAKVTDEVDKRLMENAGIQPLRLRPDEWTGGEHYWLIDAVGDGRALTPALKKLAETVFKTKEVKLVAQGEGGQVKVEALRDILVQGATVQKSKGMD